MFLFDEKKIGAQISTRAGVITWYLSRDLYHVTSNSQENQPKLNGWIINGFIRKLISVSRVYPVIDDEFCHNIKVATYDDEFS